MVGSPWIHQRRWGLAVGLATTAVGCALWAAGLLGPLDRYALDLHFRHLGTIDADPRIVLIDINDAALEKVDRWPWPRRFHAQLIETLDELGAKAIVLDVGFFERSKPRIEHAGLGPYYDVDSELVERGDRFYDPPVYHDDELRDAIAGAGNVYLAMLLKLSPPDVDPPVLLQRALELVRGRPAIALDEFQAELSAPPPWNTEHFYNQVRLAALLEEDYGLDLGGLIRHADPRSRMPPEAIEGHLFSAKKLVARRAAARFLAEHPDGTWPAFFASVLPGESFDVLTADRSGLRSAFLAQCAYRAIAQASPAVPPTLAGRILHGCDLTTPLDKLAKVAKGAGFAAFERDVSGGVIRELPLVVDADGQLLMQLGLLVAVDTLGIDRSAIRYDSGWLSIGEGTSKRRLPLNEAALTLLNWHVPERPGHWEDSFEHIPVTRVMEIALNRSAITDNEKRLGIALGELVALRHRETKAEYDDYAAWVNERIRLQPGSGDQATLGDSQLVEGKLAQLDRAIAEVEEEAVVWLQRAWSLWEHEEPHNEEERAERHTIRDLYEKFGSGQLAARLARIKDNLGERNRVRLDELRPRIAGKICLVGYTASAVPDLVTTPVYTSAPGVMVHANVINMLLQNRPATTASGWVNGALILLGGLAITLVTCTRGPLFSLAAMLALVGLVWLGGGFAFWAGAYYVASGVASACLFLAWASVTVYRQFTEERARRQFQRALAQYTSPAVAARIAARAALTGFAPKPARVTCFFSDLEGFTRLSERLGAERTRLVLNPYLGAISRVLMDHEAMVNKFIGDGIFAFFNAPVWPCADHSVAACAGAIASQRALGDLNRRVATDAVYEPLVMRIGLSTGEVFVGDYGSDTKLDYTCIGDTVNVGARLEQANKAFGTAALVDEPTRQDAGDRFLFRHLGRIVVEGKAAPVAAYELVATAGDADAGASAYIARFDRAVRHYQHCEWDQCAAILRECRKLRPHDRAVAHYQEALTRRRASPPPADWNGAIALVFK